MEVMEIVLLIAGGIIFVLSFLIPDKNSSTGKGEGHSESAGGPAKEEIRGMIRQEMDSIREHVDDVVEEAVGYAMEKTERSLERLSNEKIMAVNEYSDTVLSEIHKNHEEAMFLYDMLNNKHNNLKDTVSEVNRTVKEAEETVMNFKKLAPEVLVAAREKPKENAEAVGEVGAVRRVEPFSPVRLGRETSRPEQTGTGGAVSRSGRERTGAARTKAERAGVTPTAEPGVRPQTSEAVGTESRRAYRPEPDESFEAVSAEEQERAEAVVPAVPDVEEQRQNNNERILERYREGKSTVAIARELGLGVGEVKLVIDLFRK